MSTPIHESVAVAAVFRKGSVYPRYFVWQHRKIPVEAVTFRWRTRVGMNSLLHFSVVSQRTVYELTFNLGAVAWKLEAVDGMWSGGPEDK